MIIDLDAASLTKALKREVTPLEVAIAKNLVMDVPSEQIVQILGVTSQELQELTSTAEFQELKGFIGQHVLELNSGKDLTWDQLEKKALENLMNATRFNQDPDLNLRIAAIANKAVRRHSAPSQPLDALGGHGTVVKLQLTERFIRKLNSPTGPIQIEERQITLDRMRNPSFNQVNSLLQITDDAQAQNQVESHHGTHVIDVEAQEVGEDQSDAEIFAEMARQIGKPNHT